MFVEFRVQDDASMVSIGASAPHSSISWIENLVTITNFNFDKLTPVERKVVQHLEKFKVTSSPTIIILDNEKDSEMDKYLSKFKITMTFYFRIL